MNERELREALRRSDAADGAARERAWRVVQAAYRELKALGVPIESTIEHNVTRSIYFADPDGNRVELYCDMVEDGFETMRTLGPKRDPLDLA